MGVNGTMIVSADQIGATKLMEGAVRDQATELHAAYLDELPRVPVWTIGYGHTSQNIEIHGVLDGQEYHGTEVVEGLLIDDAEAERLLEIRMNRNADIVRNAVQCTLNQRQFDVLCDLAHNLGNKPFRKGSDLLAALNGGLDDRNIRIGPGDYDRAQQEIIAWRNAGGVASKGVYRRRLVNALYWAGLPWQWVWYSSKIGLETSLAQVEAMAADYVDKPLKELPERTVYSAVIEAAEPYIEQAREAEAVSDQRKIETPYDPGPMPPSLPASPTGYGKVDPNLPPKSWYASRREWGRMIQLFALSGFAWPAMNNAQALAMAEIGGLFVSLGVGFAVEKWGQSKATRYTK